jgi:hypothetical protein
MKGPSECDIEETDLMLRKQGTGFIYWMIW